MGIESHFKKLKHHNPGFPERMVNMIKELNGLSPNVFKRMAKDTYDRLVMLIERGLSGHGIKDVEESVAAEHLMHMIVDCEDVYIACQRAGIELGAFPFKEYIDILIPPKLEGE